LCCRLLLPAEVRKCIAVCAFVSYWTLLPCPIWIPDPLPARSVSGYTRTVYLCCMHVRILLRGKCHCGSAVVLARVLLPSWHTERECVSMPCGPVQCILRPSCAHELLSMPSRPLLWQPGINWSDWLVQRGLLLCEWGVVSHAARWCYGQYLSWWQLLSPGIQLAHSLPCRHLFQCHGADELHGVLACFCWIFLNAHRCHFVQISCVFWGSRHDALLHSLQERPVRQHFGFLRCWEFDGAWCHAVWRLRCECG